MQPWLDALKIAIIEENHEAIVTLCENLPQSQDSAIMIEAKALIDATLPTLKKEQSSIKETMEKIKKNLAFVTQEKNQNRHYA